MSDDRKLKTVMLGVMEGKRKTTQRMGGRHRRLGRGYTAETVPLGAGWRRRIELTPEAYERDLDKPNRLRWSTLHSVEIYVFVFP